MENLINKIEKKKRAYIEEIISKKKDYDDIAIYGAGKYGRDLLKFLKNNHIIAKCFCVSSMEYNLECIEGLPVISLEKLRCFTKKYLIIVAVKSPLNKEIVKNLNDLNTKKI